MLKNIKNIVYLIIFIFILYLFFRLKTIFDKNKQQSFIQKIIEKFNCISDNIQTDSPDCELNSDCNNNCCNPLTRKCNNDKCNQDYCILDDNELCNADYECKSGCCYEGKCQSTDIMCINRQNDMGSIPGEWPVASTSCS